ncbi:hypothetical protein AB0G15_22135 [Streptosporangium sp. NPDC023825]|uniref:hypothetical protein n=1 Tax=Streptosporangium sp. NPDC023825 TaxID=3154909 RepID=UPI0034341570
MIRISPYWLGVHEAVIPGEGVPDPAEIAWHGWLTGTELRRSVERRPFVPDGQEAFRRYLAFGGSGPANGAPRGS